MRGQLEARESHLLDRIAALREQLLEESADAENSTVALPVLRTMSSAVKGGWHGEIDEAASAQLKQILPGWCTGDRSKDPRESKFAMQILVRVFRGPVGRMLGRPDSSVRNPL